jgi:hypothetical protein
LRPGGAQRQKPATDDTFVSVVDRPDREATAAVTAVTVKSLSIFTNFDIAPTPVRPL